jgi:hypothetical protein
MMIAMLMYFVVATLLFNLVLVRDARWLAIKGPLGIPVLAAMGVEAFWLTPTQFWVAQSIPIATMVVSLGYVIHRQTDRPVRIMAGVFVLVGTLAIVAAGAAEFMAMPSAVRVLAVGLVGVAGAVLCRASGFRGGNR